METSHLVVLVTAKDADEAETISRKLLEDKLAACVNIIKGVRSLFWWQGKVDEADEALLVIKTQKALFSEVVNAVKAAHSYDIPEVIALPIIDGNKDYLTWIKESVK